MSTPMHDDEPITDTEQARAAALLRATDEIVAPASLHASIHAMVSEKTERRRARRRWVLAPGTLAVAAVIVAIVIVLGSSSGTPTVSQTARLALAPATGAAPAEDVSDTSLLNVSEAGIAFPAYLKGSGWTPSGVRHDTLDGRNVTTVYYRSPTGTRVGYAIVSGAALTEPTGTATIRNGVRYVVARVHGARLVTWRRDGHSCVIAGNSVAPTTLLRLAWSDEQT